MTGARGLAVVLCSVGLWGAVGAAAEDVGDRKWLRTVAELMLPDEESVYRELKEADRREFVRIFWARRDPGRERPDPTNAFRAGYVELRRAAERRFATRTQRGATTDCGRALVMLGEPAEVRVQERQAERTQEVVTARYPEVWIYRGARFPGGLMEVHFNRRCEITRAAGFEAALRRAAESQVKHPELAPTLGPDGRLIPLAELLARRAAGSISPRQGFALEVQPRLLMRSRDGAKTYVALLILGQEQGQGGGLDPDARVTVWAEALQGTPEAALAATEREAGVDAQADGSFVTSCGLILTPGHYRLRVRVLERGSSREATTSLVVDVPDFASGELAFSSPLLFAGMRQRGQARKTDPLAAFQLGPNEFVPRHDNGFSVDEALEVMAFVYGAAPGSAGSGPSLVAKYVFLKDGRRVAAGPAQQLDTIDSVPSLGPVPLARFAPGSYVVRLSLTDRVSGAEHSTETPFEVRP